MANDLQRRASRAPKWLLLSRKLSRRQKITAYVGSLAFFGICYGLGWVGAWFVFGAVALETVVLLLRPSRENPKALREAEALGLVPPDESTR